MHGTTSVTDVVQAPSAKITQLASFVHSYMTCNVSNLQSSMVHASDCVNDSISTALILSAAQLFYVLLLSLCAW